MYSPTLHGFSGDMSPEILKGCDSFFYIINASFIALILGYLIYENFKNKL